MNGWPGGGEIRLWSFFISQNPAPTTDFPMNFSNETCHPPDNLIRVDFLVPVFLLGVLNLVVIGGNILVIAAVGTFAKLRTVTNMFIVSLAVADLTLGVAVIPFSAAKELLDYWIFGDVWCRIYLAVDVWLSTASILNLCAISLDRYLAISRPFQYPSLMSRFRARLLIGSVWFISFIICFPPLIGWSKPDGTQSEPCAENLTEKVSRVECSACELTDAPGYIIYSALGSFYIPMVIMGTFYWRIYRIAVNTSRALQSGELKTKDVGDGRGEITLRVHRGGQLRRKSILLLPVVPSDLSSGEKKNSNDVSQQDSELTKLSASPQKRRKQRQSGAHSDNIVRHGNPSGTSVQSNGEQRRRKQARSHLKRLNHETKAAKTVGVIVGCFVLSWLPFFSVYFLGAWCPCCTPKLVFTIFFWLGYCNSMVNPCVYALLSRDFRFAFRRLLICKPEKRRPTTLIQGFSGVRNIFSVKNSDSNESFN